MNAIYELVRTASRIILPETTAGKVMAGIDSFGVICSVLLFGLGWKEYVDGILSSIVLFMTILSIAVTVIIKIDSWWYNRKKRKDGKEDSIAE